VPGGGNGQPVRGTMQLSSSNGGTGAASTVSIPWDASTYDVANALLQLGYGQTVVTRTAGPSPVQYSWFITFTEAVSPFPALTGIIIYTLFSRRS